jgi:probable F420-dependent oxidoreductase
MKIGIVFPQHELDIDPASAQRFARSAEEMGYSYVMISDHVLVDKEPDRPDHVGSFGHGTPFLDPFVLASFMAGVTSTIGFSSGVLILPQRQTALVAKQAACTDVLSAGRLRLGVGTGWNRTEYQGLGVNWADRGKIFEEQIGILRALWTMPAVNIHTQFHTISDAGINPLPVQRPIPIWFGGSREASPAIIERVTRRAARLADGWMPNFPPDDAGRPLIQKFRDYCQEYGREHVGLEGFITVDERISPDEWRSRLQTWIDLGADYVGVSTGYVGLRGIDQHLRCMEKAAATLLS